MRSVSTNNTERGAVAILVGIAAAVLLGFAALAIDVGYVMVARSQLQNSADAAAMAATRELGKVYAERGGDHYKTTPLSSSEKERIATAANRFATDNRVAGGAVGILGSDIVYGTWNKSTGSLTPSTHGVDSIQVRSRRDSIGNGALTPLLAGIAGIESFEVSATAASALAFPSKIPAGKGDAPFGIAKAWFTARDTPCGTSAPIRFNPTGSTIGCAGWHTFESSPANANKLRGIIDGLKNGTFTAPAMESGVTQFAFIGGSVASAFSNMIALYNSKKGPDGKWKVLVPVYDRSTCSNPSGFITIVGFATATVTGVLGPPQMRIDANVDCSVISFGESSAGASDYGTMVGVPKMIQ
jgi:Flp pilus assembly protein TadG